MSDGKIKPESWKALRERMNNGRLVSFPSILPSPKRRPQTDAELAATYMLDSIVKKNPPPPMRPGEAVKVWFDEADNLPKFDRVTIGLDLGKSHAVTVWRPHKPDRAEK